MFLAVVVGLYPQLQLQQPPLHPTLNRSLGALITWMTVLQNCDQVMAQIILVLQPTRALWISPVPPNPVVQGAKVPDLPNPHNSK